MYNKLGKITKDKSTGITLIALIITIIVLLILAAITISLVLGDNGLFTRAQEASFKTKMSQIAEEWDLSKLDMEAMGKDTNIYAGEVLKKIIVDEELEIQESDVQNVRALIKLVGNTEEKYVILHEGELYYVS